MNAVGHCERSQVLHPPASPPEGEGAEDPSSPLRQALLKGKGHCRTGGEGCTGQESSAGTFCPWLVMSSEEEARNDPGVLTSRWGEQRSGDGVFLLNLLSSGEGKRGMRVTSAILLARVLLPRVCSPLFHFCPSFTFLSSPSASSPAPEPVPTSQGSVSQKVVAPTLISPADSFEWLFGGNKVSQAVSHFL